MLIVDDDRDCRQMLAAFLSRMLDCQIMVASSVYEAEELLKNRTFDIVISDLEMPERIGTEIIATLKALPKPPELIFYTGSEKPQDFWNRLGFPCHVVLKPKLNVLLSVVKSLTTKNQVR